jgi:hypothetical protein
LINVAGIATEFDKMKLRVETALNKNGFPDEIENRNKTRSKWKRRKSGIGSKGELNLLDYFFDDLRNN